MPEEYQYSPLPGTGYIRLLRIISFNEQQKLLQCELTTHHLKDNRSFAALSYTWALPVISDASCEEDSPPYGEKHTILCESASEGQERVAGSLTITENLFDLLSQLTLPFVYPSLLWIDAVCINQQDLEERASQVSLMGQIYSAAGKVVVWLGKHLPGMDDFLWLHTKFLSEIRDREVVPSDADNLAFISTLGVESLDRWNDIWGAYYQFYASNRWFNRAWIVQEVSLARTIVVRCGSKVLRWVEMVELSKFLRTSGWQHHLKPSTEEDSLGLIPLGDEVLRIYTFKQLYKIGPESKDLELLLQKNWGAATQQERWYGFIGHLINKLRRSMATEPRDKIFAILGLVTPFQPADLENFLVPTYTGTVAELYTQVTTILLQNAPLLSILSFVEDKSCRTIDSLPSWVPDFNFRFSTRSFFGSYNGRLPGYNAGVGQFISKMSCQIDGSILSVPGACFDIVTGDCISMTKAIESISMQPFLEICLALDVVYAPTNQVREEVLWRTCIADFYKTFPAPEYLSKSFHDYVCYNIGSEIARSFMQNDPLLVQPILETFCTLKESSRELDILPNIEQLNEAVSNVMLNLQLRNVPDSQAQMEAYQHHLKAIGQMRAFDRAQSVNAICRALFRTSQGFLGLGPCSMRASDEVWMLQNARVLFILRKEEQSDNYTFIGEAYLHGFMRGEMLTPEFKERFKIVNIA